VVPAPTQGARVVAREDELRELAKQAAAAPRIAIDLEASGMFTYRARICTLQLAWGGDQDVVVDAQEAPVGALAELLGAAGPVKIVHDVSFDARLLAEVGVELGNVHDTALAARMLGRTATGLASLLESELGLQITKDMQQYDWRQRPLDERMLGYLARDVAHLHALDDKIWGEVVEHGIVDEVLEETRYRLASAVKAMREPEVEPPYTRIKGVERLAERDLAVLRAVADLREREAADRDVPPYRVATNAALLAVVSARPPTTAQFFRVPGVARGSPEAVRFADRVLRAIAEAGDTLPPEERARFERPRPPAAVTKARRERETRLLAWRREEAKRRSVDEQVVLPGHCVKDAVEDELSVAADLQRVGGIGAFRIERDGEAIVRALRGEGAAP
jgi:ribonuclease D